MIEKKQVSTVKRGYLLFIIELWGPGMPGPRHKGS